MNKHLQQTINILAQMPHLSAYAVRPDADVKQKLHTANMRKYVCGGALGALLCLTGPTAVAIAMNGGDGARKNTPTAAVMDKKILGIAIFICTAMFGGTMGLGLAEIEVRQGLSAETIRSRAFKILNVLEIQKTRPLTRDEYLKIHNLATFVVKNKTVKPDPDIAILLTQEVAAIDDGYYDALMSGKLNTAPQTIKSAITNGYMTAHQYEYQVMAELNKARQGR